MSGERAARDAADTARRDLVAAVSHDLRTPLTSLRLLTQARPPGGAGLGLAISRAIVEAHGGQMWIADSRIGARVRFTIPTAAW